MSHPKAIHVGEKSRAKARALIVNLSRPSNNSSSLVARRWLISAPTASKVPDQPPPLRLPQDLAALKRQVVRNGRVTST